MVAGSPSLKTFVAVGRPRAPRPGVVWAPFWLGCMPDGVELLTHTLDLR